MTPLATLIGSAGELFHPAGCCVVTRDGLTEHERFAAEAFAASLGGDHVALKIRHQSFPLHGRFERIWVDRRRLLFRYQLADGVGERATLQRIWRGELRHCSIGFKRHVWEYQGATRVISRASLLEISLVPSGQAVDTWVSVL
jgi:HK97 family phage prohead protease